MRVRQENDARMGQFYMLRAWEQYPVLSRPISVFDTDGRSVSFLYKTVGLGTGIFAGLRPGCDITLLGPLGNTIPPLEGRVALVGGGVGIAPLYLAARRLRELTPACEIDVFLGFSDAPVLEEEYERVADRVTVDVGGFITDEVNPAAYNHIFACGPEIMMRVLFGKCEAAGAGGRLIVSMERRMACGIGACLVCSCRTTGGNKKVCKDGPIFPGREVFGL